jgi:hypothetical protein
LGWGLEERVIQLRRNRSKRWKSRDKKKLESISIAGSDLRPMVEGRLLSSLW